MLFQRPVRERVISRVIFYSGVLVFLLLMDFSQRMSLAENIQKQREAAGMVEVPEKEQGIIATILKRIL